MIVYAVPSFLYMLTTFCVGVTAWVPNIALLITGAVLMLYVQC